MAFFSRILRSSLFRSASTYGLFSLIGRAVPFFLLPILTRYLSPQDYGYIATFTIMVALFLPFISLNTHCAYAKLFFSPDKNDAENYFSSIVAFSLTWGTAISLLVWFTKGFWGRIFVFPAEWVLLAPVAALLTFFCQLVLLAWQVREQALPYGIFQNLQTILDGLFSIIFVVLLGLSWQGRLTAKVVVLSVFAIASLIILRKNNWATFRIDKKCLMQSLMFGIPLIPHSLAGIINTATDRVFINHMVGTADTGLYSIGYQVGAIIGLFATAFNQAYSPWLFKKLMSDAPGEKKRIVKLTYAYFALILFTSIALGLAAPYLFRYFLGTEFSGSAVFVIWIALGYAFDGMYMMVSNFIFFSEKTHLLAIATLFGALINIVLNYFFISAYGAIGAAQATTTSFFLTFLLVWYLSSRVYNMPWFKK